MAELVLTEEEENSGSFLNWDDDALGKYVKKKAIEHEDYYGEEISRQEAAVITLLSEIEESGNEMVMMDVDGIKVNGEDLGKWRITFEKVDPDLPGGPPDDLPDDDDDDDKDGGILVS